jgi:UPF0716 protein FxsA
MVIRRRPEKRMRVRLFPALAATFIGLTLLDTLSLFLLGRYVGFWPTVAIIFGSGLLGAALMKSQLRRVWVGIQKDLAEGRMPSEGLLDGAVILVAAGLLATPGFLTDAMGLLLLLPPVRVPVKRLAQRRIEQWAFRQFGGGKWVRAEPGGTWPAGRPPLD